MAANTIEIIKKNAALVVGLVASMLIAPPELDAASQPVKWLAINGLVAILVAGVFTIWLPKVKRRRLKVRFIALGTGLLLLLAGSYHVFYSSWTCACDSGPQQYTLVVGSRLTPDGEDIVRNLKKFGEVPTTEKILFTNSFRAHGIYQAPELYARYFTLIAIYIAMSTLLMSLLCVVNHLLYQYATDVPEF